MWAICTESKKIVVGVKLGPRFTFFIQVLDVITMGVF